MDALLFVLPPPAPVMNLGVVSDLSNLYAMMRPRKICVCRSVTEYTIREAVREKHATTFSAVQAITGCSTGCGTCEERVRDVILSELKVSGPVVSEKPAT